MPAEAPPADRPVAVLVAAYELVTSFVAYTDDAYVRSGCLALSIAAFVPWLLVIAAAMWICMHLQTSRRDERHGHA